MKVLRWAVFAFGVFVALILAMYWQRGIGASSDAYSAMVILTIAVWPTSLMLAPLKHSGNAATVITGFAALLNGGFYALMALLLELWIQRDTKS